MQMANMKRIVLPILILTVGVVGALLLMAMKKPPQKKDEIPKPLLVATEQVELSSLHYEIISQGTVKPKLDSMLVAEINGRVIEVSENFVAGGFFKRDEVMVRIDPSDYETAHKTAQANLARAEAALQEEKARAKVAEKEWQSFAQGNAPELYLRKPQLARELANVRSAQASLETAQRDLSRTVIRAPFDAMVKKKNTEIGQYVNRGANLGGLYGTQIAEIRLPLSDQELNYISMPKPNSKDVVAVQLSAVVAGKMRHWQGEIVRSEGVVDEKSRVSYAVVELQDPYALEQSNVYEPLVYGRFVRAKIKGRYVQNIAVLPRHSLTRDDQVLVVKDNILDIREVEVARLGEANVYISSGLQNGENYVTSVIPNPMMGMAVRTMDDLADLDSEPSDTDAEQAPKANETIAQAGN